MVEFGLEYRPELGWAISVEEFDIARTGIRAISPRSMSPNFGQPMKHQPIIPVAAARPLPGVPPERNAPTRSRSWSRRRRRIGIEAAWALTPSRRSLVRRAAEVHYQKRFPSTHCIEVSYTKDPARIRPKRLRAAASFHPRRPPPNGLRDCRPEATPLWRRRSPRRIALIQHDRTAETLTALRHSEPWSATRDDTDTEVTKCPQDGP
jgi:hypothetical protein